MRLLPSIVAMILLSGCATKVFDQLDTGLQAMKGQPLSVATAKLGPPSQSLELGSDKVYIWSREIGDYIPGVPTGKGGYSAGSDMTLRCVVKLTVGPDEIIKAYDMDGNAGACDRWAKRVSS